MRADYTFYKPYKENKAKMVFILILKVCFWGFIFYTLLTHFFIQSYRLDSLSMQPAFKTGDRVISSPLLYRIKFPFIKELKGIQEPKRGDVVILYPLYETKKSFPLSFIDSLVRFFTLNRKDLDNSITQWQVKRIIGIPGDTVKMADYTAFIKPSGATDFFEEKLLIKARYQYTVNSGDTKDQENLFLHGSMDELILKEGEYFVLGDNRLFSADSRVLRPVKRDEIISKVIFRYFPLNHMNAVL